MTTTATNLTNEQQEFVNTMHNIFANLGGGKNITNPSNAEEEVNKKISNIRNIFSNDSNNDFNPKSLRNDFELLDITDKIEAVYDDALNCPMGDRALSINISNPESKKEYGDLLTEIKYCDLSVEEMTNKILALAKICYDSGLKTYQIIKTILLSDKVKEMKIDIFKLIIKQILEMQVPVASTQVQNSTINVDNGASANTIYQQPQLEQQPQIHQAGYNINDVINNINNSVYSPLDNAVKWLTNNVKFGGQIDKQEAINLYNIFNWQPFVAQVSQYYPVKDGNKRLWFRLPDYEFDKNMYKYAFGAFSGMYQDKRIIFLCNPNTGAFTTYLVNASDVATK